MNWRRDEQPVYGLRLRSDYFAPESLLTPDGRRVMWAWIRTAGADGALMNKTIQSLPRELSCRPTASCASGRCGSWNRCATTR